ncbi:hypothetical protein [Neptunomonas qingdaonensis]|uniref:Uncharacterized protein n=1 Tax=Neptunomonas qingdaonensis TaxID=1045558 RepID=A0A1I2S632_9GAMM|nr:hypothetical protein [Neptunomonas qingdaonensis]SFG47793.1 hypothetical protein SAMN05216175_107112 [Neptunomonas qingdaonensis]
MESDIVAGSEVGLTAEYIVGLSILATVGLVAMWGMFWSSVAKSNESISGILKSPAFFKVVTVIGVIAATVVLSLAGRLEGNITGAILSGIVGYVLGQLSGKLETDDKPAKN